MTSGLRDDVLLQSAADRDAPVLKYEDFKCTYKDTKQLCSDEGVAFVPMVLEATGGHWGKQARAVWTELAKASALASGELASFSAVHLQQKLGFVLHKENARAILRRLAR